MNSNEILEALKKYANFELERTESGLIYGFGAINRCPICKEMSQEFYSSVYYPTMAKALESLPWTKVIENPRLPKEDDYPIEEGVYITMMDCNEHEVWINTFHNGNFSWMNKTHIKWWMPLSKIIKI